MLPQSHIAYTWLALSVAQEYLGAGEDADYRLVALAATAPDFIDKPLAWAYFYERFKSAVLFAHTLIANVLAGVLPLWLAPAPWGYTFAFLGPPILDRLWHFPATFYWPTRGWRFHVWGNRGSEQEKIGMAYIVAFTRRPELWGWAIAGARALAIFAWRHRLYRWPQAKRFLLTGKVDRRTGG